MDGRGLNIEFSFKSLFFRNLISVCSCVFQGFHINEKCGEVYAWCPGDVKEPSRSEFAGSLLVYPHIRSSSRVLAEFL